MGILVKATQGGKVKGQTVGFDGMQRRREGDIWTLDDRKWTDKDGKEHVVTAEQQFSKTWMKKVTANSREDDESDQRNATAKEKFTKGTAAPRASDTHKI